MDHDGHVCAALPVTAIHLSVTGCHAHAAVVLSGVGVTQEGETDLNAWWRFEPIEFGPFDGLADIEKEWTTVAARAGARLPDLMRRLR